MQILNFLVSTSCLILLLLSIHLLLAKRGNKLCHLLLSFLFFCRFGQVMISLLVAAGQLSFLPLLYQFFLPLSFAAPACFYLYLSCFIHGHTRLKKMDYLHFIPALLAIGHVIPWPIAAQPDWNTIASQLLHNRFVSISVETGLFPAYFHAVLRPLLVASYLIVAWFEITRAKSTLDEKLEPTAKRWIFFFIRTATFFQLAGFVPILLQLVSRPSLDTSFAVVNSMVLLSIIVTILHQPKLFYGYLFVATEWEDQAKESTIAPPAALKKLNLSVEQLSAYALLMKELMQHHKPYLDQDFQIIDLATKINLPVHHCSYTLNQNIGKNFRDWINGYRVSYFVENYPLKSSKMTIEAIAFEAGFKSSATFYNAFKKETGSMPKAYFAQETTISLP